ncbi:MAG: hypothetical protein M1832_001683 [Thelocarpon impressellum]|nr:MAG: hypothetical protein M1832_001683 [Thelocarpon impressellum]
MTDHLAAFQLGQAVKLQDGRIARVRYLGSAHFAAGEWVGLELETATGKNNGEVQGERYFDCKPAFGMFVRPAAIKAHGQPAVSTNGHHRPLSAALGGAKRQSITGQPASGQAAKRISVSRSPMKSPTKEVSPPASSSGTSSAGPRTPVNPVRPRLAQTVRTSMGPPALPAAARPSRLTSSGRVGSQDSTSADAPASATESGQSFSLRRRMPLGVRKPSVASAASMGTLVSEVSGHSSQDEAHSKASQTRSPLSDQAADPISPLSAAPHTHLSSAPAAAITSPRPAIPREPSSSSLTQRTIYTMSMTSASVREVEDLKKKMRTLEKKRKDDREKLKTFDRVQAEKDKFEAIIQKLQGKLQPQHKEVAELRKQLKEATDKLDAVEPEKAQSELALEMATLDREMAEENAEVLKTEVEALKQRNEELELEADVLRSEREELGEDGGDEEKTSQGWLHMERENGRLREALLRLRDMTQQSEAELNAQIKSLEEDAQELAGTKDQYETTREKLLLSEAYVEDLRQQLDNALGAESLIEELTQRNMSLGERIDELSAANQELEVLRQVSDEMEADHVEYEKLLQRELDNMGGHIQRQGLHVKGQADAIEEYDYTIGRYKELVATLQTELDDTRASLQLTDAQDGENSVRSRDMADLTRKLQDSARKTQAKTIELELRRLEAQEAEQLLKVVQLFLPETYLKEQDSVNALLRFRRVSFKAHLMHQLVKDRVSSTAATGHEEDVFAACEVLNDLTWISAMCQRFVNSIGSCSTEQFAKYEATLYELEPVERALNGWIDGLRSDELRERQCASELQRTLALMSHLAEVHLAENLESYADCIHMRVLLVQSHLDNTASALSHIKKMVQGRVVAQDGDDDDLAVLFNKQIDSLASYARGAKVVVGKTVRALEELKDRSLSLPAATSDADPFEQVERTSQGLMDYVLQLGHALASLVSEEGRVAPPTYAEIRGEIRSVADAVLRAEESDFFTAFSSRVVALTNQLHELNGLAADLPKTVEFERQRAPWIARSEEMKAATAQAAEREHEIKRLRDELLKRAKHIAVQDKALEEQKVKVELLEARMTDAGKNNQKLDDLHAALKAGKDRERDLSEAIEAQVKELRQLERERESLRQTAGDRAPTTETAPAGMSHAEAEKAFASAAGLERLGQEVSTLRGVVLHLRDQVVTLEERVPGSVTSSLVEAPVPRPKTRRQRRRRLFGSEQRATLRTMVTTSTRSVPERQTATTRTAVSRASAGTLVMPDPPNGEVAAPERRAPPAAEQSADQRPAPYLALFSPWGGSPDSRAPEEASRAKSQQVACASRGRPRLAWWASNRQLQKEVMAARREEAGWRRWTDDVLVGEYAAWAGPGGEPGRFTVVPFPGDDVFV